MAESTVEAITFRCPRCRERVRVPAAYAGRKGKCPKCLELIRVPDEEQATLALFEELMSGASDPVGVGLSVDRLAEMQGRHVEERDEAAKLIDEHLRTGDSRAAVVVSLYPCLVAAYTDELDCVVMLRFDDVLAEDFDLEVGTRLLTVNMYGDTSLPLSPDLDPGPRAGANFHVVHPVIADFLSDELDVIDARKAEISEAEWRRTETLARAYLKAHPGLARSGDPLESCLPAKLPLARKVIVVGVPVVALFVGQFLSQPLRGEWTPVWCGLAGFVAGLVLVRLLLGSDLRYFARRVGFKRRLNSRTPHDAEGNVDLRPWSLVKKLLWGAVGAAIGAV